MSYEQENKQALVAYFNEGAKGDKPLGALGVEVEHFVVTAEGEHPVSYAGGGGEFGVRDFGGARMQAGYQRLSSYSACA